MMAVFRGFDTSFRSILRVVFVVVGVMITAYLVYLLQQPIAWLVIAAFLAIAVSGPIAALSQHMPKGAAIATVYGALVAIPVLLMVLFVPQLVSQGEDLVNNLPQYAEDVTEFVNENETLSNLNEDYDITGTLEEEAQKLPEKIGDATQTLSDIGVGLVSSIFAFVTIMILSIFMVSGGANWIERFLKAQEPERAERLRRAFEHIASAIGGYVGGALLQATIAGVVSFIVLTDPRSAIRGRAGADHGLRRPDPGRRRHDRGLPRRRGAPVRQLPRRPDRLDHLRDRLPAGRELRDPAADPAPGRGGGAHRDPGRGAVRINALRSGRRAACDPGRRIDPDRGASEWIDYRRAVKLGVESPSHPAAIAAHPARSRLSAQQT